MDNLTDLGIKHGTDKVSHGYTKIYHDILNKYKNEKFNFMEIGVFYGASIKMWNDYFNKATIYAADNYIGKNGNGNIFLEPDRFVKEVENDKNIYDRVNITYLDQSKEDDLINFLNKCNKENIKFKIILDDGSHLMKDQQLTFFYLFDLLEDGGIFIMENTHTSDQQGYDVLPDKSNSTKKMLEELQKKNLKSIYFNNEEKINKIINSVTEIQHFRIKEGSETTIIFKKQFMQKIHFITFGGPSQNYYDAVNRLCNQAKEFNLFDTIIGYTDKDLKNDKDFWEKNGKFIKNNTRGYGYWIWKAYLIKKSLENINDDDILLYLDCGCELNIDGIERFKNYLIPKTNEKKIIGTYASSTELDYTKMDLIEFLQMEKSNRLSQPHMQAGCLMMLNCDIIKKLYNEIYDLTSNNYHLIDDTPSLKNNHPNFIEHRHDQSVFNLFVKKYNLLNYDFDPTYWGGTAEADVYNTYGKNFPIWYCRNRTGISIKK